jgi:regulator of protease activity HflC (stomatin/prohibitin superfamily)
MNRQMSAERERRAMVTKASGEREAAIAVAEGEKQAAILRAQGEKESAILEAEGERQAQALRAQGYALALQTIAGQAKDLDTNTMALQYLEALQQVASSPSTKFVLPMEVTSIIQQITATVANGARQSEGQR